MLLLLMSFLVPFVHAEAISMKTLIASRASKQAVVLVESKDGFSFLDCPFIPNVERGTIEVSATHLWTNCDAIGRTMHSAEELERVTDKFVGKVAAYLEYMQRNGGRSLVKSVPTDVALGFPAAVVAGVSRLWVGAHHAERSAVLNLPAELRSAARLSLAMWAAAAAFIETVDLISVLMSRAVAPTARYLANHEADVRSRQTVVLEDGWGGFLAYGDIVSLLDISVRSTPATVAP